MHQKDAFGHFSASAGKNVHPKHPKMMALHLPAGWWL